MLPFPWELDIDRLAENDLRIKKSQQSQVSTTSQTLISAIITLKDDSSLLFKASSIASFLGSSAGGNVYLAACHCKSVGSFKLQLECGLGTNMIAFFVIAFYTIRV
jgi:hypothetical protein